MVGGASGATVIVMSMPSTLRPPGTAGGTISNGGPTSTLTPDGTVAAWMAMIVNPPLSSALT